VRNPAQALLRRRALVDRIECGGAAAMNGFRRLAEPIRARTVEGRECDERRGITLGRMPKMRHGSTAINNRATADHMMRLLHL
jgi:hypothetical protein